MIEPPRRNHPAGPFPLTAPHKSMKINSVLYRYLFRELLQPFALSIVFLTFVFLMTRMLDIADMIVNHRVGMGTIALLLFYSMPFFLEFIIPMSVMMSVLLTFLRMSADNEIAALKAGGIGLFHLLPPVLAFCLIGALMTAVMAIFGLPEGRMASKKLAFETIASNTGLGLEERRFNDRFENVMFYVGAVDSARDELRDIFIEDARDPDMKSVIAAPRGTLRGEKGKFDFHLRLYNGSIHQAAPGSKASRNLRFDTYDMILSLPPPSPSAQNAPKDEEEMSIPELRAYIAENDANKDARYYLTLMELHKKFSLPLACFALGVLAFPLGIQSKLSKRSYGIGLGMIFFILYYLMLSAGWVFGEAGVYPPFIGMWAPNLVMGAIGLALLFASAREYALSLDFIRDSARAVLKRFPQRPKGAR
ncbi:LPS export ABC transporter permease LptF [Candidatus Desulfarcum epimagneticum]|uniref:LPS export ABC transporter permease LptF n=1 Tax=uncultured Desulfobacteraceae bacterium TaxID=218296 RepID=A0A484HHC0_9BACT|nr:LPS export ABC transporter permease LptF [uncultured Desulfobacteraceae bacterium]